VKLKILPIDPQLRAFDDNVHVTDGLRREPRLHLQLPNLRVRRRMHFAQTAPDRLSAAVVVENVGQRGAPACELLAIIRTSGGLNDQRVIRCPALPAGSWVELPLGEVAPAPPGTTVDVQALIDPPTANRPGGQVWESNELDNLSQDSVLVLAPSFDDPPLGG
jgi:hypothetical protein